MNLKINGKSVSLEEYCNEKGLVYKTVYCYIHSHPDLDYNLILEYYERKLKMKKPKNIRLYRIWFSMFDRCYNDKNIQYKNYGGRGIKVANTWFDYFQFESDMIDLYQTHEKEYGEKDTTLERIDVNGNYCKENCIWITKIEQLQNKRNTKRTPDGQRLKEYCLENNLNYNTIQSRLRMGWTWEDTINKPIEHRDNIITPTGEILAEYCKNNNLNYSAIKSRLDRGWTLEKALSEPIVNNTIMVNNMPLKEYCRQNNISYDTIQGRLKTGWSLEDAINKPIQKPIILSTGETINQYCDRVGLNFYTVQDRLKKGWTLEKSLKLGNQREFKYTMPDGTPLVEYCRQNNLKYEAVRRRIQRGWTLEDAITKPLKVTK